MEEQQLAFFRVSGAADQEGSPISFKAYLGFPFLLGEGRPPCAWGLTPSSESVFVNGFET